MLKKVIVAVEWPAAKDEVSQAVKRLVRQGLPAFILSGEQAISLCGQQKKIEEGAAGKETTGLEEILFVADEKQVCQAVQKAGGNLLLYLHEGNRKESYNGIRYALEGFEEADACFLETIYHRLRGIPRKICTTDRCLVREMAMEDLEDLAGLYRSMGLGFFADEPEDPKQRSVEGAGQEADAEKLRAYIEKIYGFYGFGLWAILDRTDGRFVGCAGFSLREGFPEPELGYAVMPEYQRQGYAYEVCSALLRYGKEELGFTKVQALIQKENLASRKLCRKLGFAGAGAVSLREGEYERYLWHG